MVDGIEKPVKCTGQAIHLLEPFNIPGNVKLLVINSRARYFEEHNLAAHVNARTPPVHSYSISMVVSDDLARKMWMAT
ncbi:MAG: hypothetical protein FRX48_01536 [Lasallia pustulata]|uniref:Uncharacterized protein n=1 Tax=Lasallia pustulata TaxID=136370 RepID=A0A5M8Q1F1_9LECA|nr:MAG: hypothetical protein FRX48_01536 [Lasallia pustulata]